MESDHVGMTDLLHTHPWTNPSHPANPKHYSHPFLPANYLDGISAFGSSHEAVYIGKR